MTTLRCPTHHVMSALQRYTRLGSDRDRAVKLAAAHTRFTLEATVRSQRARAFRRRSRSLHHIAELGHVALRLGVHFVQGDEPEGRRSICPVGGHLIAGIGPEDWTKATDACSFGSKGAARLQGESHNFKCVLGMVTTHHTHNA
jgi:hypothetical protein